MERVTFLPVFRERNFCCEFLYGSDAKTAPELLGRKNKVSLAVSSRKKAIKL